MRAVARETLDLRFALGFDARGMAGEGSKRGAIVAAPAEAGVALSEGADAETAATRAAITGAVTLSAAQVLRAVVTELESGDQRLRKALDAEAARDLDAHREPLERAITSRLEVESDEPAALASIVATFDAWRRARRSCADARKARVIMAALMNAFDREAYEEGLTLSLFRIIEQLDYPEIECLKSVDPNGGMRIHESATVPLQRSMLGWHLERLRDLKLVWVEDGVFDLALQFLETRGQWVMRTQLGIRLLKFIADGRLTGGKPT